MNEVTPADATKLLRLIWFGLIVAVLVISSQFIPKPFIESDDPENRTMVTIAWCLALAFMVAAHVVRQQVYKRHWVEHVITPRGYILGNIIHFACLDIAVIQCIFLYALTAERLIFIAGLLPFILLLLNFPTGTPMQPDACPWARHGESEQTWKRDDQ